jgi:hypothetical protein
MSPGAAAFVSTGHSAAGAPQRPGNAKGPSGSHRLTIGTGHVREPPICAGTVPSVRSVGGMHNGIFCRAGIFWRMCNEIQRGRTVLPDHGQYDSEKQRKVHPGEAMIVQIIFRLGVWARRFTSPCAVADFGEGGIRLAL